MRLISVGLIAVAALAGCVSNTATLAWREGATLDQADVALAECQAYAVRQVPTAMSSRSTPVYRAPSNIQCTTYGNQTSCHDYGGQVYGGQSYSYDANAELRDRIGQQCLAREGYQIIDFPRCTAEQAKNAVVFPGKFPKADTIVCLTDDGTMVLK